MQDSGVTSEAWHVSGGFTPKLAYMPVRVSRQCVPTFYVGPGPGDRAVVERAVPPVVVSGARGVEFRGRAL